ncbi:MAG: putative zinc-binding metallopeptidase [bacterium]|nr:putative zinc-binding metallopeptidase [bacterium]
MRDVLRHEYGHAFAYWYPGLVRRSREFTEIFGNRYDSDIKSEYDPDEHLTPYAAKRPAEDFAESFMAFVKGKVSWSDLESPHVVSKDQVGKTAFQAYLRFIE